MGTTIYTFTPASGTCAATATMAINVQKCVNMKTASEAGARIIPQEEAIIEMDAKVWPNPTQAAFSLLVTGNRHETAAITIFNVHGQPMERKQVAAGQVTRFGDLYRPGIYIVEIRQGTTRKTIKVIRQ